MSDDCVQFTAGNAVSLQYASDRAIRRGAVISPAGTAATGVFVMSRPSSADADQSMPVSVKNAQKMSEFKVPAGGVIW